MDDKDITTDVEQPSVRPDNVGDGEHTYVWKDVVTEPPHHNNKPPKAPRGRRGLQVFAAVATTLCILSMMCASYFAIALLNDDGQTEESGDSSVSTPGRDFTPTVTFTDSATRQGMTLNEISTQYADVCVSIVSEYSKGSGFATQTGVSLGSGFIITEDGYVVTNHHVIENSTKITVIKYDGTEYEAQLVNSIASVDIAVLKIEGTFTAAKLGDSSELQVGDFVCAIGTPSSLELAGTMTYGIISAINRNMTITDSTGAVVKTMSLLQTDATLNPGNSGGPLINMYGEVIGINTLKLTDEFEGIAFSIPMSYAIDIINALIAGVDPDTSTIVKSAAYLGITTNDISEWQSEYYGIPTGVYVYQIETSGAAYEAGLRMGDIIVEFNGTKITNTSELSDCMSATEAGKTATIKFYRGGEYTTIEFVLDARPE